MTKLHKFKSPEQTNVAATKWQDTGKESKSSPLLADPRSDKTLFLKPTDTSSHSTDRRDIKAVGKKRCKTLGCLFTDCLLWEFLSFFFKLRNFHPIISNKSCSVTGSQNVSAERGMGDGGNYATVDADPPSQGPARGSPPAHTLQPLSVKHPSAGPLHPVTYLEISQGY